ncbi:cytochrome-c peroxidase [Sphingobium sp. OAS761]|uniref:cytochrome-c peroxidase n=1 Tax=Sphingobium sp. OAS761 TaxID=2817901 RepID=UPI00209E81DB|nr:cytochrome c peroxidase [Sphingobium sp. OAS761]
MVVPLRFVTCLTGGLLALGASVGITGLPAWRWQGLPGTVSAPAVPADNPMSAVKVALGRRLFYDRALSRDGSMACADCHQQARGFSDGQTTHMGVSGEIGIRNVPGLANVAWRPALTWTEAGISSLEEQALIPMTGTAPVEMGMDGREAELVRRINADPCYRRLFALAFPRNGADASAGKVAMALGAFQRTMISFDSRADRYIGGDRSALSPMAVRGLAQFRTAGCAQCHQGRDFTDAKLHYVGTAAPSEADGSGYGGKPPPPGFVPPPDSFRTPSLRNVAVTGPWLHDGKASTLDEAIRRHAASHLPGIDMDALLAFLDSLTDRAFLTAGHLTKPSAACPVAI